MRFYLGIFVAAVVIFFWGFVVWTVLAVQFGILKPLPKEEPIHAAIVKTNLPTGVYIYPMADAGTADLSGEAKGDAEKALKEKTMTGPIVRVFFLAEGMPSQWDVLATGFFHMLLATAIMATLTRCVLSWTDFKARYAFVVAVAVFAAVWIDFSNAIWMGAPWRHQLFTVGYDIGAWLLAGFPIAWGNAR